MMKRFIDLKILGIVLFALITGCQKLAPESVSIPEYPDLKALYVSQVKKLGTARLRKEVTLDTTSEEKTLQMDTLLWKKELSFLAEMNPTQPEYVGVFEKITTGKQTSLVLKPEEKGILRELILNDDSTAYSSIHAIIHEDKDIYVHHREIEVSFENGLISHFNIKGYQKVIFKDTVRFEIEGKVN